jgi:D-beta-D-heptose 7-phosphate kinase/D-beta-D-heptose 1-phosphate adenosyltransferase
VIDFATILDKMRGSRVLVVGDFMLDEYIEGRATRISQEAPVVVILQKASRAVPGGAANVAANIVALGGIPSVVGVIGQDSEGDRLQEALTAAGLDASGLVRDPSRPTTRKTRVLADGSHQVLRIDHEQTFPLDKNIESLLLAQVTSHLKDCDAVLLSDYRKGTLTATVVQEAIAQAVKAGKTVVANAKPDGLSNYRGATLVSLNQFEASKAANHPELLELTQNLHPTAMRIAHDLECREGIQHVLVTLRGDGMATADFAVDPVRVEVADEAGAGDTTIATVTLGMAGLGYCREIFQLAAETSAAVVQKVGVATPDAADLKRIVARAQQA